MTTTLPDPATGTDAGTSMSVDLRAEAERLAAMARSWTPSISELLEEETRRHDTGRHETEPPLPSTHRPPSSGQPTLTGPPSLADLDRVLDQLAANDARIATLHAERAVLLARVAGLAEALETDLLDEDDPAARRAPSARRIELAHRAVTTEIATALHLGEHAAGTLTDHARTLAAKAPATLTALREGRLSWAHATAITTHLADLSSEEAAAVERSVLTTVLDAETSTVSRTPAQVARRARRARETAHPTPADVRHADATASRAVWVDDGRDGMAWLVAHLPAPLAHAAYDRLTRTARHLAGTSSGQRTLAQARADTLAAPSSWTTAPSTWQPPPAADLVSRPDRTGPTTGTTASRTSSQRSTRTRRRARRRRRATASRPACPNSRSWPPSPARSARRSPSPSRS